MNCTISNTRTLVAPAPSVPRLCCLIALAAFGCGGGTEVAADAGPADSGIRSDVRPSKRSDFAGVADPASGLLALFGGDDGPIINQTPSPSYLGDTWIFDPNSGWEEVTTATAPSIRGRQAVAHDPNGGRMLLFGGRFRQSGTTGNYTLFNDVWAFDFAQRSWTPLHDGAGEAPAPRYFAAAAYVPQSDTFYVYGGDTNPSALTISASTDLWSFDGSWQQTQTSGSAPSSRLWVGYTYDSTRNRLIVFGGQVGDFVTASYNDLYALDLSTFAWQELHDGSGQAPTGRFSSLLTYDHSADQYLMTAGHADQGVTNDLWAFDPVDNTWSRLNAGDSFTGAPLGCLDNPRELPESYVSQDLSAPERRSGGLFAQLAGRLWLFGGESDCSDHLDDTWWYDLDGNQWTEVISARSGESCARRADDCACLCL